MTFVITLVAMIVMITMMTGEIINVALFGSEAWVLKKREEQRLEAAQKKFLRHLLGITELDKENLMY